MGQVWQATDTQLNRHVALKILSDAFADDPDRLTRFQREAQVLASLNHPGIAQIHGIEYAEGTRATDVADSVRGRHDRALRSRRRSRCEHPSRAVASLTAVPHTAVVSLDTATWGRSSWR